MHLVPYLVRAYHGLVYLAGALSAMLIFAHDIKTLVSERRVNVHALGRNVKSILRVVKEFGIFQQFQRYRVEISATIPYR